jgi:hypothetical protein
MRGTGAALCSPATAPGSRRWSWRWLAAALLALSLIGVATAAERPGRAMPAADTWPRAVYPSPAAVRRARSYAAAAGDVSFAVLGGAAGLRGHEVSRSYSSASASKGLLLAAALREFEQDREPLDAGTRSLLEPMIRYSDNRAAAGVYAIVGDSGMQAAAERAGMGDFAIDPGFWGGAQITAADAALFYGRLERNLGDRYRDYGLRLLGGIIASPRWGIPAAAGPAWKVWFKGGWRPSGQEGTTGPVTHQAALLVHRGGERIAIAVLSNEAPAAGGFDLVEGVAERLLDKPPPRRNGWPAP